MASSIGRTELETNFAEATPKMFCGYTVPRTDFGGYDMLPARYGIGEHRKKKEEENSEGFPWNAFYRVNYKLWMFER